MKRLLHFLRLRYLALALLVWFAVEALDIRGYVTAPVLARMNATLSDLGYPNSSFKVKELTLSHLILEDIVLDSDPITRDPISTIEKIEAHYSPIGFFTGRAHSVTITRPDLFYSAEALPHLALFSAGAAFSDQIPAKNIDITDLNISYAGDDFNPNISGSVVMTTDESNLRRTLINLTGEQKDFTLTLKIASSITASGQYETSIDLPELKIDIPKIFMISRAQGHFRLNGNNTGTTLADGKFVAGAMRIKGLPLDKISLALSGKNRGINIIGNAAVTGVPDTNISLRIGDHNNASQALLQFSGDRPAQLATAMGLSFPLPKQQKFSTIIDLKGKSFTDLVSWPVKGGVFFYGDNPKPIISANLHCQTVQIGCIIDLPTSPVSVLALNDFLGPYLASQGLTLTKGDLRIGGQIKNIFSTTPPQIQFESSLRQASINWKDLRLDQFSADFLKKPDAITLAGLSGTSLGGSVRMDRFDFSSKTKTGSGRLVFEAVSLDALGNLMRTKGLVMTGNAAGNIPFRLVQNNILIDPEAKITAKDGTLSYAPKTYPMFLTGGNAQRKALRDVLQDFSFSHATLDITSRNDGTVNARLLSAGRNAKIFGDNTVQIDLKIDDTLAPGISALAPNEP